MAQPQREESSCDDSYGAALRCNNRPLSFYDNLTVPSAGTVNTEDARCLISPSEGDPSFFPNIRFRFEENIPASYATTPLGHRSQRNSARLNFFGLSDRSPVEPMVERISTPNDMLDMRDGCVLGGSLSPVLSSSTMVGQSPEDSSVQQPSATTIKSRPNSTGKTISIQLPPDRGSASEAVYMKTTVPQNFAKNASTLIGRHKPTRSSLRHSRMLFQNSSSNKGGHRRFRRGNSLNLRYLRLSKVLMVLKILIGALLSLIGLGIMVWSPSTHTKDNPYWSGLILILCGTLFLVLFAFKRSERRLKGESSAAPIEPSTISGLCLREKCFYILRVNALVVLVLAIFFTMLAVIYALMQATTLASPDLRCVPEFSFNVNASTCVCTLDPLHGAPALGSPGTGSDPILTSTIRSLEEQENGQRLEYRDFNCNEVLGIWYYVTIASAVLNSLGCLLAASFLLIYSIDCMRRCRNDRPPVLLELQPMHKAEGVPTGHGEEDAGGDGGDGTAAGQVSSNKHRDPASNQPMLAAVRILEAPQVEARANTGQPEPVAPRVPEGGEQEPFLESN